MHAKVKLPTGRKVLYGTHAQLLIFPSTLRTFEHVHIKTLLCLWAALVWLGCFTASNGIRAKGHAQYIIDARLLYCSNSLRVEGQASS